MSIRMGLVETIRELLNAGMDQDDLARRLDVTQPTVSRWLNGSEPRGDTRDKIIELAKLKGIRPNLSDATRRSDEGVKRAAVTAPTDGKIPVMGIGEGGDEGWSLWNGEVIEWVERIPPLHGVANAYSVYVIGHSMEPRYLPGEKLYIHPGKPLVPGCFVLVQRRPEVEGDTPLALVARLDRKTPTKYILSKLNPPRQVEVSAKEAVSVHRVVGSGE